jgi:hypothetical protein
MADRTNFVHLRRVSGVLSKAIREGPDGTIEGKHGKEHPDFIRYSCAMYLAGSMAYLEGEDGGYSWHKPSASHPDFDAFAAAVPPPPKPNYRSRGISVSALDALACVRNALVHNDGDLSKNRDQASLQKITAAKLPGVRLTGTVVRLEAEFLDFTRVATLAVRQYHGDT